MHTLTDHINPSRILRHPKAMVALMAMLFQNGTVGTTGPAMWLPAA